MSARADPRGGRSAMVVPTATDSHVPEHRGRRYSAIMQRLTGARGMVRIAGVVIAVAIAQYTLAFYAWSVIPGNAAPGAGSSTAAVLWITMCFPLFYIVPRDFEAFQSLLVCNALIWGFTVGFFVSRLFQRSQRTAR